MHRNGNFITIEPLLQRAYFLTYFGAIIRSELICGCSFTCVYLDLNTDIKLSLCYDFEINMKCKTSTKT